MAKKVDPVAVKVAPNGNIAFSGGTFEDRVEATVNHIIAKNGGAESVKEMLKALAAESGPVPGSFLCGTAEVTNRFIR